MWRQICFEMASFVLQCTIKIVNVSQQRCSCISFHNVTIIANYIGFTAVTFRSFNFQGLPYFLFLYLASLGNVSGADQLNWPWHIKQCYIAPELSHFLLMLSGWLKLFWSSVCLFHLCSLHYSCNLMRTHPGENKVEVSTYFDKRWTLISSQREKSFNVFLFLFFFFFFKYFPSRVISIVLLQKVGLLRINSAVITQLTITCLKLTTETL